MSLKKSTHLPRAADKDSPFYVSPVLDLFGRFVQHFPKFWLWLGKVESTILAAEISAPKELKPIYICGLARSGSTLLHEILTAHPEAATHRMRDYPMVFTPYWWRQATASIGPTPLKERPHRDKMMISSESPDAIEEMIWMAFFSRSHDPAVDNRLDSEVRHLEFERFYRNHLRKILLAERASRYVAKANYHVARIRYLLKLFPGAKFVLPIREPESHIASLMRQHEWFSDGQKRYPRAREFMKRSGHFEFGLDRRPINFGDSGKVQTIAEAWSSGNEVAGWASYWAMVYQYLADLLDSDSAIRRACMVVRFEELCDNPSSTIHAAMKHCSFSDNESIIQKFAPQIRRPDYYRSSFSRVDRDLIHDRTESAAKRWGYPG